MSTPDPAELRTLRTSLSGTVLTPSDDAYEEARRIWNAMIDKRPTVIAQCVNEKDVVLALRFARAQRLPVAVRGGGHNIAGTALCDDGLVIDLSRMTAVAVDPKRAQATVEGGATLADLDGATLAHGLATPLGINSTTGVAGLTLGGGFGWLSRKHGMTVDNLVSARIVTADGEVRTASVDENPDLFWALRGGGGNFGVVTRFDFRVHPVGPDVLSGLVVFPLANAGSVLRRYRDYSADAPDELSVYVVMRAAPPLPFLPEAVHGTGILVLALMYAGNPSDGERHVEAIRGFGTTVGEHTGVQPYTAWQQAFDPLLTPGFRNYWKSHNFDELDDDVLDTAVSYAGRLPSPHCEVIFAHLGGATSRRATDAAAYAHRDTEYVMNLHGRWEDPADDDACVAWARGLYEAVAPYASGSVYVNFVTADEPDRVRAAYGANYDRLAEVKRRFDPQNVFSTNFNIAPA